MIPKRKSRNWRMNSKIYFTTTPNFKKSVRENKLKEDANIIQHKGRPIPIHLQDQVADKIRRLIKMAIWKEQLK